MGHHTTEKLEPLKVSTFQTQCFGTRHRFGHMGVHQLARYIGCTSSDHHCANGLNFRRGVAPLSIPFSKDLLGSYPTVFLGVKAQEGFFVGEDIATDLLPHLLIAERIQQVILHLEGEAQFLAKCIPQLHALL